MKFLKHLTPADFKILKSKFVTKEDQRANAIFKQFQEIIRKSKLKDTDGCTWGPDFDFESCCNQHDLDYNVGGLIDGRKKADEKLRQCISQKGSEHLAEIYYLAVRIFGEDHYTRHR